MKRGRLPLTALRSFEAAGRHLSFSRAAEELFVSQAAISRQVRELEETIGRPLFTRLHRKVELTDVGRRLLGPLTRSFDEIDQRLSEVLAAPAFHQVIVTTEPYLANSWLLPRLNRFQAQRPDIDVTVHSAVAVTDFRGADKPDVAVRHSIAKSSWPGVQSRSLFEASATPMISPGLLSSGSGLQEAADVLGYTLLHLENRSYWSDWLAAAGVPDADVQRGLLFPDGAMAAKAAVLGQGVTLGDPILDSLDLEGGRLLRPFELSISFGRYWLVAPDFNQLSEAARAFTDWLMAECGAPERGADEGPA